MVDRVGKPMAAARTATDHDGVRAPRVVVFERAEDVAPFATQWDARAVEQRSPFMTFEWLRAWSKAFDVGKQQWVLLLGEHDELVAGAACTRSDRSLSAMSDDEHSGEWDVVAAETASRSALWNEIASRGATRIEARSMSGDAAETARRTLSRRGYRALIELQAQRPYVDLPHDWSELLGGVSRNLRSQFRRRRRALEESGSLTFRTVTGGDSLDADLDRMFAVEAAGWKGRAASAILSNPATETLYRDFARAAAARGWLRLSFLELDATPIAVDYGCAFGGGGFLLKTGFDERYGHLSPGLVLRGEVLRSCIDERLSFYDFLGGPDAYKLRWASTLRPRFTLRAYRGRGAASTVIYRQWLRPALKTAHRRARRRRVVPE
jgi:CelD/BcsL family acetyltransferase involved in cellulose biosynthesis